MTRTIISSLFPLHKKSAFTLVEMVISLSIVSFLTILLFQGYRTLADISLRVEHQKNLTTESVFFLQNLQQLVDNSTVDYSRYDLDQLKQQHWYVTWLYLSWSDGQWYHIMLSWSDCLWYRCWVVLHTQSWSALLLNPQKVGVQSLKFRIIPYSPKLYDGFLENDQISAPWFWLIMQIGIYRYQPSWAFDVAYDIQQFYTFWL